MSSKVKSADPDCFEIDAGKCVLAPAMFSKAVEESPEASPPLR